MSGHDSLTVAVFVSFIISIVLPLHLNERKSASKREQRPYIAEREQIQDDEVELKRQTIFHPLRRFAPRPTCLRGTVSMVCTRPGCN